jgi:hypothetical protein
MCSGDPALHVFSVETVYTGTAHEHQGVLSPVSGATCGLELVGNGAFVVFATRSTDLGESRSPRWPTTSTRPSSAAAPPR